MQTYSIPGRLPDLNTEIRAAKAHWSNYARTKKAWTLKCASAARGLKPCREAINLYCLWKAANKRIDPDNLAFATKYILDGLVAARVLPDDNWKYVKSIHHSFTVDKHPGVEVTLSTGDI
jgi:hypothetical protein